MSDADWFVPTVVIVGIELILSLSLAASGHAPMPLFNDNGLLAYVFMTVVALVRYLWFLFQLWRAGETDPIARSIAVLKANGGRIIIAALMVQILTVQAACFNALKAAIPNVNPFWADPFLMRLDALPFGEQPWRAFYPAFGGATPFFDGAYAAWVPIQIISIFSVLLVKPSKFKSRAILSFVLAWLLIGIISACALSSAGPIFYDRLFGTQAFVGLPLPDAPDTAKAAAMLWASYQSGQLKVGSGISAMPSMHVSIATITALLLRRLGLAWLGWFWLGAIWLGSVHLGWHYASDGIVSVIGTLAVWKLVALYLERGAASPHTANSGEIVPAKA